MEASFSPEVLPDGSSGRVSGSLGGSLVLVPGLLLIDGTHIMTTTATLSDIFFSGIGFLEHAPAVN
jgi:hypothetical protein